MDGHFPMLHHFELPSVVEILGDGTADQHRVRVLHCDGTINAWSWLTPVTGDATGVCKAITTLIPLDTADGSTHVVTRIHPAADLDVFGLTPDDFGRKQGIVFRCRDVVDAIQSAPLRRFLSNVFSIPSVYRYFWTSPASQAHHHAYPGGLADHSIEIAENVMDTPRLSSLERDVGIAHALVHDIGKLWCYAEDGRHLMALGHELVGLHHLHDPLEQLSQEWPDGAIALQSLLSGLWKQRGGKPIMSVGKLVQAYDQTSAERELRSRKGHKHQPWEPAPYETGNVLTFRGAR